MELKPCPFCGEAPTIHGHGDTISISCDEAFCGMASIHGPIFDYDSLVTAWNTRADLDKAVADEQKRCLRICNRVRGEYFETYKSGAAKDYYFATIAIDECISDISNRGKQ